MVISTENDDTIDHNEIINLRNMNQNLIELVAYPKNSLLQHDNIQRSVIDVEPGSPQEWINPNYENLLQRIGLFLNK